MLSNEPSANFLGLDICKDVREPASSYYDCLVFTFKIEVGIRTKFAHEMPRFCAALNCGSKSCSDESAPAYLSFFKFPKESERLGFETEQ